MGRCQEFGPQIRDGCGHAMRPGEDACFCPECGVTCKGLYAGCPDVWKRGPRTVNTAVMIVDAPRVHVGLSAATNGNARAVPGSAASVRALDAGSASDGAESLATMEHSGGPWPEPEIPERPDTDSPESPDTEHWASSDRPDPIVTERPARVGEVVPEDPATWGLGKPARSGATMRAEQQLDSLLAEDFEVELEPPADRPPGEGAIPLDPEPNSARPTRAGGRVPLTSDWDPATFTDAGASRARSHFPGASGRGVGEVLQPAVPAEMDDSDPRTHVLKWMEKRFDGIRAEVQMLANSANRQQEALELLLDRQAEMDARLEQEAEAADVSGPGPAMGAGAPPDGERVPDDRAADLLRIASDELGRLVDEVVTALHEARAATASAAAAQSENTERLRLLQAAVTKQLRTMATSLGDWEERSEKRAAAHARRLEALAGKEVKPAKATTAAKATKTAKAAKATRPAKVTRTAKRTPPPAGRRSTRAAPRH